VQRVRDLNLSESTSEMARISASAILLLVAITDFLRESVVFLKQSMFRAGVKAGIGNDAVTKSKDALDEVFKEFRSTVSDAVNFRALEKDQKEKDEVLIKQLSETDFKKMQIDVRNKCLKGTGLWILDDPIFRQWLNGDLPILWCSGTGKTHQIYYLYALMLILNTLAGAGKTLLT
jgi:hypothetical protein